MEINKKVAVQGNQKYGKEIIQYLINTGAKNDNEFSGGDQRHYYYVIDSVIYSYNYAPDGYELIPIETVLSELERKEEKNFPRMMWVWQEDRNIAIPTKIHGYISTLESPWIDSEIIGWNFASQTDPRMPELTIEQAEEKFNIRIKRP